MSREEEDKREKEIEEIPEKKEEFPDKKGKLTEKMRENPWVLSTLVLGVVTLILLIGNFSGGMTGGVISEDIAGERILEFVNSQVDGEAELVEINFENGLYEVIVLFEEREIPVYITADGKNLVQGVTPLDSIMQQDQQQSERYSEEDLEKISTFIDCLAEKDVKIYGANWCGWTEKLVIETLGGFDVAAPIYVECTEETELCSSEDVEGYPTIKIDGELYEGSRTFEGFAEATGCIIPEVNTVQSSTEEATCG
ncbi:hypothetical protein ES703_57883 [subsurface metagenome]